MKFWNLIVICSCFCVAATENASSFCITPNDEKASCVLLSECPLLLSAFASKNPDAAKFVQASSCGTLMVCCGTSSTFTKNPNKPELLDGSKKNESLSKEERRDYVIKNLLPNRRVCGQQHTDDYGYFENPLYNSSITSVDEFPWMVYLLNRDQKTGYHFSTDDSCAGVLINNRYVLTDYNCSFRGYTNSVIVGQHRIYEDESCVETPFGEKDCTSPPSNEIIEGAELNGSLNIAILRFQKPIGYSDFVRPICLPLDESEAPKAGDVVTTSGWGAEEDTEGTNVKTKKRVKHTLMDQHECENANPVSSPICGLILPNSTSKVSPGDNGGPLMYRYKTAYKNWVALGIVTGRSSCAEYQPVVATKITPEIVHWIIDNIKP